MDWFLALTEDSPGFRQYSEMVKVAIHTATMNTSLRPHFIYDGEENELTTWLQQRQVPIIRRRSSFRGALAALGEKVGNPYIEAAASGAFLRAELPVFAPEFIQSDRVLYTDCDVIFRSDVVPELEAASCGIFAVAPEHARDNYEEMNTGVMLMNLPALRESNAEFCDFISANLEALQHDSWDEGAYRRFYRAGAERKALWDRLLPELNWKPYRGDYRDARILHFHGPKPFQRDYIDSHFPELKYLTGGCYEELIGVWQQLLADATQSKE